MTVTAPDNDGYCDVSDDAINDAVEKFNITIIERLRFTDNIIRQQIFDSMKVTARSISSPSSVPTSSLTQSFTHLHSLYLFTY